MKTRTLLSLLICLSALIIADRPSARVYLEKTNNRPICRQLWDGRDRYASLDSADNIIAVTRSGTSTEIVSSDSCTLFRPVPFTFDNGFDAIKYWYDLDHFFIESNSPAYAKGNLPNIHVVGGEYRTNGIALVPGDEIWYTINPDKKTFISDGFIFDNEMQISTVPIGASVREVMAAINPSEDVDLTDVTSISFLKYTIPESDFCRPFNYFQHISLIFDADTLKCIRIGDKQRVTLGDPF